MAMMDWSWPLGGMMNNWWWPFGAVFGAAAIILGILIIAFWIWMIVDSAKRKFRNDIEKVIWIAVVALGWVGGLPIGALVYLIVIRNINPSGLAKK